MPTQYELEVLPTLPLGQCELVANEQHFRKVVQYGIARAQTSVDILTADFKAMLVPLPRKIRGKNSAESIVQVLRRLADRNVEIRLLHAGTPTSAALRELRAALPANLTIRRCPRLHAKAVILDARAMYLGSANLTGAGLGAKGDHKRNFELGIWTESAPLIESVLDHFNTLWEGHACHKCRRKDICPVPLEEPAL
jgi:phosphatidylserine/phosphatidylglycerophosphate/cardiolipin synthase-like enzyme